MSRGHLERNTTANGILSEGEDPVMYRVKRDIDRSKYTFRENVIGSSIGIDGMLMAEYRPRERFDHNNIASVRRDWRIRLCHMYGRRASSFLITGAYELEPMPELPSILTSRDSDTVNSIEYREANTLYLDGILHTQRSRKLENIVRSEIFAIMLLKIDASARDHMSRDKEYASLVEKCEDPLALWNVMKRSLTPCRIGDSIAQQNLALESYLNLRQGRHSIMEYYEKFSDNLFGMVEAGCKSPCEKLNAYNFLMGLNQSTNEELLRHLHNGVLCIPETLHEAFVMSHEYKKSTSGGEEQRYKSTEESSRYPTLCLPTNTKYSKPWSVRMQEISSRNESTANDCEAVVETETKINSDRPSALYIEEHSTAVISTGDIVIATGKVMWGCVVWMSLIREYILRTLSCLCAPVWLERVPSLGTVRGKAMHMLSDTDGVEDGESDDRPEYTEKGGCVAVPEVERGLATRFSAIGVIGITTGWTPCLSLPMMSLGFFGTTTGWLSCLNLSTMSYGKSNSIQKGYSQRNLGTPLSPWTRLIRATAMICILCGCVAQVDSRKLMRVIRCASGRDYPNPIAALSIEYCSEVEIVNEQQPMSSECTLEEGDPCNPYLSEYVLRIAAILGDECSRGELPDIFSDRIGGVDNSGCDMEGLKSLTAESRNDRTERELEIVNVHTAIEADESSQLMEEGSVGTKIEGPAIHGARFHDKIGGAGNTSGGNEEANEARSDENGGAIGPTTGSMIDESSRHHYPVLDDSSRSNPVGAAWSLPGKPVEASEGRPQRVTRAPDRLTYDSFAVSESLVHDVAIMDPASRRVAGNRTPYCPSANRSTANHADDRSERHHSSFIVAVERANKQFGGKAVESLHKELTGLHQKEAFSQVLLQDLNEVQRKSVIRSKLLLKEKFFPHGIFDKLESRLVAGGDMQIRNNYSEDGTASPTVGLSSVYLILSLAAREKRKVGTADVGMAYLNAKIGKPVFDKRLSQMLTELFPDLYQLDKDGCVYVRLNKALYGCVESAKLWYDKVSSALIALGFTRNPHDICVFNIDRNGHQLTVCLYVNDLLMTSVDESDIEWVVSEMRKKYETVTLTSGPIHSYLGQTFDFSVTGEVSVSMEGYIRDVLDSTAVKGFRTTPGATDLYEIDESAALLTTGEQDDFHSLVMRLMFLAQRARPDILTAVVFLSSRCMKATTQDKQKLDRVLSYLNSWPDLKMFLACDLELGVHAYVDASFAVHHDMKSPTGSVITLRKGAAHVSSTESELVGMSDTLPQVIWTRNSLIAQGYDVGPAHIFQDNMSTIALAAKGRSTSSRTRHIVIRFFFVKDRIDSKEVEMVYKPTSEMTADVLTKPLQGELFRKMRARLLGMPYPEDPSASSAKDDGLHAT